MINSMAILPASMAQVLAKRWWLLPEIPERGWLINTSSKNEAQA
jgi:hypothetical protein